MQSKNTDKYLWLVVLASLLIFLRAPSLLIHGHIYGEEGTTYLRYAWDSAPLRALIAPHQGYYSLIPNVCALISARLLPVAMIAVFMAWCAFGFQLLTVWLASSCEAFTSFRYRAAAAFLVIVVAPSNDVWVNTITVQFWLAICCGIILISDPEKHKALRYGTLLIAGLNGVVSCFLIPFYWVRAYQKRNYRIQAAILTSCAAIQVMAMVSHGLRKTAFHPQYYPGAFLVKNVILLYLGRIPAFIIGRFAISHISTPLIALTAVLSIVFIVFLLVFAREGGSNAVTLCLMGLWIQAISLYGSLDAGPVIIGATAAPRYYLILNVFQSLAILLVYAQNKKTLAKVLLILVVVSGLTDFALYWRKIQSGPRWGDEIAYKQSHPNALLHITPEWWRPLNLSPVHQNLYIPFDTYDSTK